MAKKAGVQKKPIIVSFLVLIFFIVTYLTVQRLVVEPLTQDSNASDDSRSCFAYISSCARHTTSIASDCRGKGNYNRFAINCSNAPYGYGRYSCGIQLNRTNDACITAERALVLAQMVCCDQTRFSASCGEGLPVDIDEKSYNDLMTEPLPTLHPRSYVGYIDSSDNPRYQGPGQCEKP